LYIFKRVIFVHTVSSDFNVIVMGNCVDLEKLLENFVATRCHYGTDGSIKLMQGIVGLKILSSDVSGCLNFKIKRLVVVLLPYLDLV